MKIYHGLNGTALSHLHFLMAWSFDQALTLEFQAKKEVAQSNVFSKLCPDTTNDLSFKIQMKAFQQT